jgi:hypothetical protein
LLAQLKGEKELQQLHKERPSSIYWVAISVKKQKRIDPEIH